MSRKFSTATIDNSVIDAVGKERKRGGLRRHLTLVAVPVVLACVATLASVSSAQAADIHAGASSVSAQGRSITTSAQSTQASLVAAGASVDAVAGTRFKAAASPLNVTARKTWAFTQCIFSIGVPIGAAIAIATNPWMWRWVLGWSPQPTLGSGLDRYITFVKSRCGYALF